jgi:hypothetical protein
MSAGLVLFLEFIAPLVILIVYVRIKNLANRSKLAALQSQPISAPAPFEPKPEPTPNLFMRRFTTPQRAYLRQQIATGKAFYYVAAWAFIVFFTSGLLPQYVNRYGTGQPLAQRVWYSFLLHTSTVGIVFGVMMLMAALLAVGGVVDGSQAIFNRTRPLTLSFLFLARVLPAIATILASLVTGMAVSFLLLLIFYGPVWLHLLDASSLSASLTREQASHLVQILQTSVLRTFLSLITTALLIFSVAVALISQPFPFLRNRANRLVLIPLMTIAGILGSEAVHFLGSPFFSRWSRILFMYTTLGPPPPYVYALVPILASASFLVLAAFCISRVEP